MRATAPIEIAPMYATFAAGNDIVYMDNVVRLAKPAKAGQWTHLFGAKL